MKFSGREQNKRRCVFLFQPLDALRSVTFGRKYLYCKENSDVLSNNKANPAGDERSDRVL